MADCPACTEAVTNPDTGIVYINCPGCNVRSVSKMPNFAREAFYATLTPPEWRAEFAAKVTAEFHRRRQLRGALA